MPVSFSAITNFARRLRKDKSGVTAIEYGLIAGAVAVAILTAAFTLGGDLKTQFTCIGNSLTQGSDQCANGGAAGN